MASINSDVNLHELTMLVLKRSEFVNSNPEHLAIEVAQKYMEIRHIILEELKKHTNYGTMVIK